MTGGMSSEAKDGLDASARPPNSLKRANHPNRRTFNSDNRKDRKQDRPMAETKRRGRPSSYTDAIGQKICARLIGGESLRAICRDDDMPDRQTVTNWLINNETFFGQYTRAREAQADCLVDEILEISDDGSNDWMERRSEAEKGAGVESGWVLNGEHVQRSRLRVDTRKWFASKVFPKRYGDKVEHTGPEGGPIVVSWAPTAAGGTSDPSGK